MQKIAVVITIIITAGIMLWLVGPKVAAMFRLIYSPHYNEKSGLRGGLAAALGFFLSLAVTIYGAVSGWRMNGFFGALEIFLLLWLAFGCVLEVIFRIHLIARWLQRTPTKEIIFAGLFLPVCLLTGYLVGRFAGFPIYRAFANWMDEIFSGRTYSDGSEWYDMCVLMSVVSSVISWGVFASRAAAVQNWLKLLLGVALISIAACFVPLGVGGVIAWLVVAKVFLPLCCRYVKIYQRAYDATSPYLSHQLRDTVAKDVASDPMVFLFADVGQDDEEE